MNRVTDFLPAVCAIDESSEKLSHTSDCLEATFCVVRNRPTIPFAYFSGREVLLLTRIGADVTLVIHQSQ